MAQTVAMVGAGQLARMTQQAAIALGVKLTVLADGEDDPAVQAGAQPHLGSAAALNDLRAIAQTAPVLTFDHEQVDPESLVALESEGVTLAPSASAHLFAQDKLHQRRELAALGFPIPPFLHARTAAEAAVFGGEHGWPVVGKPPRGGYDGNGVFILENLDETAALLRAHPDGLVLEPLLDLEAEIAVLVARSRSGEIRTYPVVQTVQVDGMLRELIVPAPVDAATAERATAIARDIAERIEATGIMALELFLTPDGLFVNELALRPHNSGHWTIEGAVTSQFENHLRAVLGLPLGNTALTAPSAATVNVVGPADGADPRARLADALGVPDAKVHLYGKAARAGRKLGHVTVRAEDPSRALAGAREAARILEGAA
ncbi:MAG: 5-(carboxyamino)imidazole ribonucleotide synthase [Solirubrobacteraceae bacterium]